jgi:hypothetical protein
MNRKATIAWTLALFVLFVTGVLGLFNGLRELSDPLTPLQRSVSVGVLVYGVLGLAGGIALMAGHRAAAWLAAVWGVIVTYVASIAPIAYGGAEGTLIGAVASGIASALIAVGVVWVARTSAATAPASMSQ